MKGFITTGIALAIGVYGAATAEESGMQSEPAVRADPDSVEAKSLETANGHALRPDTEMAFIAGGDFNGEQIAPFHMDRTMVTVENYRACVKARVCKEPPITGNWSSTYYADSKLNNPVNEINWYNATTFCHWAGKRLPTALEWEWAARGREEARVYPWGDKKPTKNSACWMRYDGDTDTGGGTCPVAEPHNESRDGVYDMAGNLWEWTASYADADRLTILMKGGAWYNDDPEKLKATYTGRASLYHGDAGSDGFRCVRSDEEGEG